MSRSRGYVESEDLDNVRERVFYTHLQNSPTTSTFPKPPSDRFPRRGSLSQPQDTTVTVTAAQAPSSSTTSFSIARGGMSMKRSKNTPPPLPPPLDTRSRSDSYSYSYSNGKGKEPLRSPTSLTDQVSNFDRYYGYRANGTSSSGPLPPVSRPATADSNISSSSPSTNGGAGTRRRGSLLVAASDALNIKFGRRRASTRGQQAPTTSSTSNSSAAHANAMLSDVIEIRAPLPVLTDAEEYERSRLRDEAAQAIGLGSYIVARETPREDRSTTVDEDYEFGEQHGHNYPWGNRGRLHGSSVSVTIPINTGQPSHPHAPQGGRYRDRAGSVQSQSRNYPTASRAMPMQQQPSVPIPPFPSTIAALTPFVQSSGEFPKYYPPSTLRIFALSKNWKNRYILLSTPANVVTQNQTPAVSYLHLFKTSSSGDESNAEIERLEINEDSVVFVSEDEVGGRRQVIKVGGADVGSAQRKEYSEGGHSMWLLQMTDQALAHVWISNIKNAILGQRTVRAGLIPHSFGGHEPRGDMDTMLSIRAQGLLTSPASPTSTTMRSSESSGNQNPYQQGGNDPNYASSISSQSARSQTSLPRPSNVNAVSVLKGLFSSGRPRSSSRATSINSDRQLEPTTEGSFASMGNSLLGMLRSSTPDAQSINTVNTAPTLRTHVPIAEPITPMERRLDRPIMPKPQSILWSTSEPIQSTSPDMTVRPATSPTGPPSLQPPPRKRWTSTTSAHRVHPVASSPTTPTAESSKRISFSASVTSKDRLESPAVTTTTGFSFGSPQTTRAASLKSVSTYASADKTSNVDKSSLSSTKRSSGAKRWSRPISMLPSRSNPPSDPPPAIPHPYANDQKSSSHGSSQNSHKSFVSALPKFAKRQSGSSVQSFASFSTSHSQPSSAVSHPHPRASTSSRNSMPPPPLPAPTSALPPAPTDPLHDSRDDKPPPADHQRSLSMKSNYRNSIGNRNFRTSMIAPKPPPSANLPPRPDQPEYKAHHQRTLSGEGAIPHSKLESIPASPVPPAKVVSPFPPPSAPLPPTPPVQPVAPPEVLSLSNPPVRTSSLKQRLRNLSAPAASSSSKFNGKLNLGYPSSTPSNSGDTLSSFLLTTSTPPTPIGEKIATFTEEELNGHPSFLQMTPDLPSLTLIPVEFPIDPPPEEEPTGFTELPPPPRRGSKQILDTEVLSSFGAITQKAPEPQPTTPVHTVPKHFSLSRPGSALSHHSARTQTTSEEGEWDDAKDEATLDDDNDDVSPVSPTESISNAERPHFSLSRPASIV